MTKEEIKFTKEELQALPVSNRNKKLRPNIHDCTTFIRHSLFFLQATKYTISGHNRSQDENIKGGNGWSRKGLNEFQRLFRIVRQDRKEHGKEFNKQLLLVYNHRHSKAESCKARKEKKELLTIVLPDNLDLLGIVPSGSKEKGSKEKGSSPPHDPDDYDYGGVASENEETAAGAVADAQSDNSDDEDSVG